MESWIDRMHGAMAMARGASTAESRLIHYDLAGRYSVMAAGMRPFMLPRTGPATEGERAALRLPRPHGPRFGSILRRPPEPPRRNPGESEGEGQ